MLPTDERDQLMEQIVELRTNSIIYDAENSTSYEEEITGLVRKVEEANGINDYTLEQLQEYHKDVLAANAD